MLVFNVELDDDEDDEAADNGEVIEPSDPFGDDDDCVDDCEFWRDKLPLPFVVLPFCDEILPLADPLCVAEPLLLCVIIVVFGGAANFGIVLDTVRNLRGNTTSETSSFGYINNSRCGSFWMSVLFFEMNPSKSIGSTTEGLFRTALSRTTCDTVSRSWAAIPGLFKPRVNFLSVILVV